MQGQREGLLAGGNVLMPGFIPQAYRQEYRLYDNKRHIGMEEVRQVIESAGYTHSLPQKEEYAGHA